jgi:hypothetical protein
VISSVKKGGAMVRTKQLHARIDLSKEAMEEMKIKVVCVHTMKMFADRLMKILEGEETSGHWFYGHRKIRITLKL